MKKHASLDRLDALERALVAKGWRALSSWWRATLQLFVRSRRRQLVARVGRRGGKSSTLCMFAVAFALSYDVSQIPKGDIGVVAFISTTRDEANQRLRTIKQILDALGIAYSAIEHGIELVGRPIAFKVFVASIAGVAGFTSILVICDEVARWRDADSGANPASEVLASLRPTMATQPKARIVLSSSPLGKQDAHAKAFARGDDDHQITAHASSWVANPTLSEDELRRDEPDPRVFAREYAAIPQGAKLAAFDASAVDRAFRVDPTLLYSFPMFGVLDPSSGKKDVWSVAAMSWCAPRQDSPEEERRLVVHNVDGIGGEFWSQDAADKMVDAITDAFRRDGIRDVYSDQRESFALASMFSRRGFRFTEVTWTNQRKERAVQTLRRWLRDGTLIIAVDHRELRAELHAFEERITSTGALTFAGGRGVSGADDFVALLLTAAMASTEPRGGDLPMPRGAPQAEHPTIVALKRMQARGGARFVAASLGITGRDLLGQRGRW